MSKLVSLEEIRAIYPTAHHEPRDNCKYCGGTGKIHKKTKLIEGDFACICIFVDHDLVDFAQQSINETIQNIRDGK